MADKATQKMKRIFGGLNRSGSTRSRERSNISAPLSDTPETTIVKEVMAFCEAGSPSAPANAGDEYLHLPAIVDAAESSPSAAADAANRIRKYLGKDNYMRAYAQYNAIMLMRILTDNPGRTFTKNFDSKFIGAVKDLLRDGRDMSVQQILRETLDAFQNDKAADNDTLVPLMDMWKKEKQKLEKRAGSGPPGPGIVNPQSYGSGQNFDRRQHHRSKAFPGPEELASRIEEAKTTAKLLSQTVQSTPTSEIDGNELIKEFADRTLSASRNIQGYINSGDPALDEDTLLTLIETNDQLSVALSKHQRALLQARRNQNASPNNLAAQQQQQQPQPQSQPKPNPVYAPSASPPPGSISTVSYSGAPSPPPHQQLLFPRKSVSQATSVSHNTNSEDENPYFQDHHLQGQPQHPQQSQSYSLFDSQRVSPLPRTTPPPPPPPPGVSSVPVPVPLQPPPLNMRRKVTPPATMSQLPPPVDHSSHPAFQQQQQQNYAANTLSMRGASSSPPPPRPNAVELPDTNPQNTFLNIQRRMANGSRNG